MYQALEVDSVPVRLVSSSSDVDSGHVPPLHRLPDGGNVADEVGVT